ncbi:AraC family transcriptional regulator [Terriglobus albidus]|uniref:AraC family transcriptional regulator n=1 Tax=Terriglobus albidus TaxID=1592106 RepID=UPI0021DFAAEC|nr:helix-turn-helix transcriptional regulator [Terriglobus albidus]
MRHPLLVKENDPGPGIAIATHEREYPRNSHIALHSHGADQLVYASRGVMEIASGQNFWLLPPHFGLWIPAYTPHSIRMPEHVSMRTLYLRPGLHTAWATCTTFHVVPFLRELIFQIVGMGRIRVRSRLECAYRDILIAQLKRSTPIPTGIALPRDTRALAVAEQVLNGLEDRHSVAAMCASVGIGVRTLQRVYQREVGLDFESWRRQVRLMKAVQLLVSGLSIKEVSYAVGYQEPSTFIDLFRSVFGRTPKSWTRELAALSSRFEFSPGSSVDVARDSE